MSIAAAIVTVTFFIIEVTNLYTHTVGTSNDNLI